MAKDKELAAHIERTLERAKNRPAVTNLLGILFPRAEKELDTFLASHISDQTSRLKRRISSADFSHSYFALTPGDRDWGRADTEKVLAAPSLSVGLGEALARIDRLPADARRIVRETLLEDIVASFASSPPNQSDWFSALAIRTPEFTTDKDDLRANVFSLTGLSRLRLATIRAFRHLEEQERTNVLLKALRIRSADLTLFCEVTRSILGDLRTEGARRDSEAGFGDASDLVRKAVLTRVRRTAALRRIWDQAIPRAIVWFWWGATEDDEVYNFCMREIVRPKGLLGVVATLLSPSVSSDRGAYYSISSRGAGYLVDLPELQRRVAAAVKRPEAFSPEELQMLERFESAVLRD